MTLSRFRVPAFWVKEPETVRLGVPVLFVKDKIPPS
jgi:hypothetical protein